MSDNIIRFPRIVPHNFCRDGNIDINDIDRLVWSICPYLRDLKECEGCPEYEEDKMRGKFVKGCRMMALEVINICQTGNPWRK